MDALSGILQGGFNKSFQHGLIIHLARCEDLAKEAMSELRPADFSLGVHQAVWEVTIEFLTQYRRLPPTSQYLMLLARLIENPDGRYTSYVSNEEHPALVDLLADIERAQGFAPDMYRAHMPQYVKWARSMKVLGENMARMQQGGDPGDLTGKLVDIGRSVDTAFSREAPFTSVTAHPELPTQKEDIVRVTTGLNKLDQLLDKGPQPGNLVQITACPGVGKSNLLIHMGVAANFAGYRCLLISLELPGWMFKHRYIAMAASITGATIKKPVCDWTDDEIARLAMLMSPNYPMFDMCQVADYSKTPRTIDQIEELIAKWKDHVRRTNGSEAVRLCREVSVDWQKYLLPSGCTAKTDQWDKVSKINEQLGFVAKRQDVVIYTANQGKASADKKTLLDMGDTAFGYHTNDALDVGIGAALTTDSRVNVDEMDDDMTVIKERRLNLNVNKNRTGQLGSAQVYQAPTLRFFDTDTQYHAIRANLGRCMADQMEHFKINMPATVARSLVERSMAATPEST
jgi:hypothetical protein